MEEMTPAEARHFLLDTPRTGKLATVRADGRPHVAPIWFDLDGDDLMFTTWHTSVKAANLRHNGQIALCVDDEQPPYAYVIVEGTIEFVDGLNTLLHWATRLASRYMGPELGVTYGKRNGVEGELLVRVTITKLIGYKDIAD